MGFQRRERDSNPRYSCLHNGFRDRPVQPLWHLSIWPNYVNYWNIVNSSSFVCLFSILFLQRSQAYSEISMNYYEEYRRRNDLFIHHNYRPIANQ